MRYYLRNIFGSYVTRNGDSIWLTSNRQLAYAWETREEAEAVRRDYQRAVNAELMVTEELVVPRRRPHEARGSDASNACFGA